jgi:SAM-dependent methyltransferase
MTVYRGEYARLYDLFYADKPYDAEVEFTDRLLRDNSRGPSQRLLDVACGTGQHAIRFAARGWDVVGVDQSEDMLKVARESGRGTDVEFLKQDMRSLDLPGLEFDAAVCLFDSIGYGVTNEGIVGTLSALRRHIRQDGLLAIEFWHAAAMLCQYEAVRVRQFETAEGEILRISMTTLDVASQLARVDYSIHELGADGQFESWNESHENRYFLVQEMRLLLDLAGFVPIRFLAGFDASAPVNGSTWHVVALARAGGSSHT